MSAEASRGRDDALAVVVEKLPVDAGLVVVALEIGPTRQLDEVLVTDLVLGQQAQVIVELARIGLAARVVETPSALRPLAAMIVGHIGLGADDRLDADILACLVEVEDAVHVAVVGHRHRRLAIERRRSCQVADSRRPVEHRELGVHVKMGERTSHETPTSLR